MKIGIVGAGLLGRLLAWQLSQKGHVVSLFDKTGFDQPQAAGWAAAAMLTPFSEALTHGEQLLVPGLHSIGVWKRWLKQLSQQSASALSLNDCGSLLLNHAADQAEFYWTQRRLQRLCENLPAEQPGQQPWVQCLDRQALIATEPELMNFSQALWLPYEACVDNRQLFVTLMQVLREKTPAGQVRLYDNTTITRINQHTVFSASEQWQFDQVVDCRGVGAASSLTSLRGVRGEVIWVHARDVTLNHPVRLMHPRYQLYISPRPNQYYVVGATEIESQSTAPITVRSTLELLSALYSVHKGFAEAHVIDAMAQCRPAYADNLPALLCGGEGLSPQQVPGVLHVNGLYRHGYLLAPLLVERAVQWLERKQQVNVNSQELLAPFQKNTLYQNWFASA